MRKYRDEKPAPAAVYVMLLPFVAGIVGCALVYPNRRGPGWIMEIADGARAGSIIALVVAALFLVVAVLSRRPATQWAQAVMSSLLGIMSVISAVIVMVRLLMGEPSDADIVPSAWFYVVAAALQAGAATISFSRPRATPRSP